MYPASVLKALHNNYFKRKLSIGKYKINVPNQSLLNVTEVSLLTYYAFGLGIIIRNNEIQMKD